MANLEVILFQSLGNIIQAYTYKIDFLAATNAIYRHTLEHTFW